MVLLPAADGETGRTGTPGSPQASAEVEPPLSPEGTEHHRTSTTSTIRSRLSPPSPKPSVGILTKFAKANAATQLEPGCVWAALV